MASMLALLPEGERPGVLFQARFLELLPEDMRKTLGTLKFETCREMGLAPTHGSAIHADFTQVNQLLDNLIDTAKEELKIGLLGQVIPDLGALEDRLAGFGILASRELAWTNAELLWHAQVIPALADRFLAGLDQTTAMLGKGLLLPV